VGRRVPSFSAYFQVRTPTGSHLTGPPTCCVYPASRSGGDPITHKLGAVDRSRESIMPASPRVEAIKKKAIKKEKRGTYMHLI
jgi:hypothetical protein